MNREIHVRFWERPEVKALRATRQKRTSNLVRATSALPAIPDIRQSGWDVRFVPKPEVAGSR